MKDYQIGTNKLTPEQTTILTLYQCKASPFCVKVRRAMKCHGLNTEVRNVKQRESAKSELLAGGGDLNVPCLGIGEGERGFQWMYEFRDNIG